MCLSVSRSCQILSLWDCSVVLLPCSASGVTMTMFNFLFLPCLMLTNQRIWWDNNYLVDKWLCWINRFLVMKNIVDNICSILTGMFADWCKIYIWCCSKPSTGKEDRISCCVPRGKEEPDINTCKTIRCWTIAAAWLCIVALLLKWLFPLLLPPVVKAGVKVVHSLSRCHTNNWLASG